MLKHLGIFVAAGLVAFPAVSLTAQSSNPPVINACVSRAGELRIVSNATECRRHENSLAWSAQPPGLDNLRVIDSNGSLVGILVDPGTVARVVDGRWVGFNVTAAGFIPGNFVQLFYASFDCTGPRYFVTPSPVLTPSFVFGATAFYGSDPVELTVNSYQNLLQTGLQQCNPMTASASWIPVAELDLSTLHLTAPFVVVR